MTADTVGGVWTYAIDLARALSDQGFEIALATMGGPASPRQRSDAQQSAILGVFESSFRLPWMDEPWRDVAEGKRWLLELCSHVSPDIVHVNDPVYASNGYDAPTVAVGHSCVLSWWQAVWNVPAPSSWQRYRSAMTKGLASADAVIAPSQSMLDSLRRYYGVERGQVIPNGRDSTQLTPGNKEEIVFAAGRVWDPAKNLMALDGIADGLPWSVYVAGEQRHPHREGGVEVSHIQLLGCLTAEDVADWLARASIYAFPARYEPFGLSVLEAALAGCALVLSDIPTLREQWDGKAVFVELDDPATLRLAIHSLIQEPDLRQMLAMRARRHALTLTSRRMASAYSGVYTKVLAGRRMMHEEVTCAS
ncbi:MAG TPA: glycosyltransferase family 4 protein [Gemmatimonadales bacterium]|nr:glycosyltransferase family 4 protein [Gemmatimonadales bacterium]